jgi:2-iminobutanoate/2-iminopropanoate deaminase
MQPERRCDASAFTEASMIEHRAVWRPDREDAKSMLREIIRVEPLSSWLENWKAPVSPVVRCGDMVYVSGLPPFDVATGQVASADIETQTDIVLRQMQLCLEAAGSDLNHVVKCNVYCTSVEAFAAINAVYARYFPRDHPARIFICVPSWPGAFDIEIDCVAVVSGSAP